VEEYSDELSLSDHYYFKTMVSRTITLSDLYVSSATQDANGSG
jgi:hypothetical protein